MAISLAEDLDVQCPACGHVTAGLTWLAIDVRERPDLHAEFQERDAYMSVCAGCGEHLLRDRGLLVLGLAEAAPVVLGCSDEQLFLDDPVLPSAEVIDAVNAQLLSRGEELPGPVLVLPFAVLAIALSRDVDTDACDPQAAERSVAADLGADAAELYAIFMGDVAGSSPARRMNAASHALFRVTSVEELRATLALYPELLTPEARARPAEIAAAARASGDGPGAAVAEGVLALLERCANGDEAAGWADYEQVAAGFGSDVLDPQVRELQVAFDAAVEQDLGRAAAIGDELVAAANLLGMRPLEAVAAFRTSSVYYDRTDGDLAENVERCCRLLERVLELFRFDPDVADRSTHVWALMNLAAAVGGRHRGDPGSNQERAIALGKQALDLVTKDDDGHAWALAQTNLGLNLIERERDGEDEQQTRDRLAEAIGHFDEALTWRSFERDPNDYAYTQVNLALALMRLGGRAELERAIDHGVEAARGFAAADKPAFQAQALGNLGSARQQLAQLDDTSDEERVRLLDEAERDTRTAIDLGGGTDASGIPAGRRWSQLARVLAARDGYTDETRAAFRRVLEELTPRTAPAEARDAGGRLGHLAAEAGDWAVAAEAWEQGARGGAAAVASRATRNGRLGETTDNGTIFRWAAYALVRAGEPERAVEVVELGRGRELASWLQRDLVDIDGLRRADRRLCARFLEVRQRIERAERTQATIADPGLAAATEELRDIVAEIRTHPGLETFLLQPSFAQLSALLPSGETIAYPVTSPYGSAWLLVGDGAIEVVELPEITSTDIMHSMLRVDTDAGSAAGYLVEQPVTGARLDDEIAAVEALVGPRLLEPLDAALSTRCADQVTIVPLGTLGQLPLQALSWEQDGARRCLLDRVAVTTVPSAYVRQVALTRASGQTTFGRLVAVGNPLPQTRELPDSELEAAAVAQAVPAKGTTLLTATGATKAEVVAAMPGATHIHLACHGEAVRDLRALDGGLFFASDEQLTAAEILEVDLSRARLVVASACETGVIGEYETVEESLALSTVLLGAGAAGVVATLWQVNDYATSLLMARFYEELVARPQAPAHALRIAQLWLRDLNEDEERDYAARHPALRARGDVRRRNGRGAQGGSAGFGRPTLWAAFAFSGA
jgi:CHAT domain-containing protein/tetratricopeptide (TPR) repeat protein